MVFAFPGMNPYLESPEIWPNLHHCLIVELLKLLSPQLRPKYKVSVEVQMYETIGENVLVGLPDVAIQRPLTATNPTKTNVLVAEPATEPLKVIIPMPAMVKVLSLQIRGVVSQELVTAIEILSPANKPSGKGRETYLQKRQNVLASYTHLVEIDLLRNWQPMPFFGEGIQSDYRILVSRANHRPRADLYAFNIPDNIPKFPIPLKSEDVEPVVDLQPLLESIYEYASYALSINYNQQPTPPFTEKDANWADNLLRQKQCRQ